MDLVTLSVQRGNKIVQELSSFAALLSNLVSWTDCILVFYDSMFTGLLN